MSACGCQAPAKSQFASTAVEDRVDDRTLALEEFDVPDILETAKSGRANCRGCGRNIARGELRFGEALPNAYAEGESLFWFHLLCAACMRPEKFGPMLDVCDQLIPEQEWLLQAVRVGIEHPRLPRLLRAERATSGKARCRQCREVVNKDSWRLVLQMFEEGRMQPIGTIHVECAEAYFDTVDIIDRIGRLTQGLSSNDLAELQCLLMAQRHGKPLQATTR
jgi:hypothetical protein